MPCRHWIDIIANCQQNQHCWVCQCKPLYRYSASDCSLTWVSCTGQEVRFLSSLNHHKEHLPFPAELEPEPIYSETSFLPSELNVQNKTKHKIVKLDFICITLYDICKLLLIS